MPACLRVRCCCTPQCTLQQQCNPCHVALPQTFAEKLAKLQAAEGGSAPPAEFSLNFLWLDKNIAVAVDQVFGQVRCSRGLLRCINGKVLGWGVQVSDGLDWNIAVAVDQCSAAVVQARLLGEVREAGQTAAVCGPTAHASCCGAPGCKA